MQPLRCHPFLVSSFLGLYAVRLCYAMYYDTRFSLLAVYSTRLVSIAFSIQSLNFISVQMTACWRVCIVSVEDLLEP